MHTKKKWLGGLLNFLLPGLGYVYGHNVKKGIVTYSIFLFIVFSIRFITINFTLFSIVFLSVIFIYLFIIVDGYKKILKNYSEKNWDKWSTYIFVIVGFVFISNALSSLVLKNITPINFVSIPTPAMEPTLMMGDAAAYHKTSIINQKDVVIFKYPEDRQTIYSKRCVGIPGDSLQIIKGEVYINGKILQGLPELQHSYLLTSETMLTERFFSKYDIFQPLEFGDSSYLVHLTLTKAQALNKLAFIKKLEIFLEKPGEKNDMLFTKSPSHQWHRDNFGPIYLPKKSDVITITNENIDIYEKAICFENEVCEVSDSTIYINGQKISKYTFKNGCYFMMGDSRHNSADSRYWGFVPEELLVGKVLYLYWSKSMERIGKEIL